VTRAFGGASLFSLTQNTYVFFNQLFACPRIDLTQVARLRATGHTCNTLLDTLTQREWLFWLACGRDFQSTRNNRLQGRTTVAQWLRSIVATRSYAYWNRANPDPFVLVFLSRLKELALYLSRQPFPKKFE